MATRTATAASSTSPVLYHPVGTVSRTVSFNPGGTALSAGDVVQMLRVPVGAIVNDVTVKISSSAQSYTTTIGDGDDADRYFATQSLVLVQVARMPITNTAGFGYQYTAEDTIDITFSTITSGTAANCDVTLMVTYSSQN